MRLLAFGLAIALSLAIFGATLIVVGYALIADSNAQVAAAMHGQPCNGHSACLTPGISQPEGQLGVADILRGIAFLAVGAPLSVYFAWKARRLFREGRESEAGATRGASPPYRS